MIDVEKVIGKYLRTETGARVVGKTPDDTATAWVRLTLINDRQQHISDRFREAYVQLDCYAGSSGGQPEAIALGNELRAALVTIANGSHEAAVVSGARIEGHSRMPDTDFEPARERIMITATVWLHALSS
jgi:hypothetical protein